MERRGTWFEFGLLRSPSLGLFRYHLLISDNAKQIECGSKGRRIGEGVDGPLLVNANKVLSIYEVNVAETHSGGQVFIDGEVPTNGLQGTFWEHHDEEGSDEKGEFITENAQGADWIGCMAVKDSLNHVAGSVPGQRQHCSKR
jgi:hypothetical protein